MTIVQVVGLVLMIAGAVSLIALLYLDLTGKSNEIMKTGGGFDLPGWLAKLPARYLPSVAAILLGWAMYSPATFADTLKKLSGTA